MSRSQLNILVQLAKVDGIIVQDEIDLIKKIGSAKGMTSHEISSCFDEPGYEDNFKELSDDEKFEYIYNIVQLMKIDGRLYKEEIGFCAKMASKLGYEEKVLMELMLKIYSDPEISANKDQIKSTIQSYLKH